MHWLTSSTLLIDPSTKRIGQSITEILDASATEMIEHHNVGAERQQGAGKVRSDKTEPAAGDEGRVP